MTWRRCTTLVRVAAAAIALARIARAARRRPPLQVADSAGGPTISVVVPARDEAARLGPLLEALRQADDVAEVIVVDDQSSDSTAALATATGAIVVNGEPPPAGWAGKAWALQQGLAAATGEWVVTLDADTRPSPRLARALVARAQRDGLGFVTVGGRFECPSPGVRWLHPAMLTTLIYRFGAPDTVVPVRADRHLANGQCMAFRRSALADLGGFGPVAGHVVEDVALARHLASAGWHVAMVDGAQLLTTRMFETGRGTFTGWARSLALPQVEPRHRQLVDVAVVVLAQVLPLPRLLTRRGDVLDMALLAMRLGTLAGTRSAYEHHGVAYWTSPAADAVAATALAVGVVKPRQSWRGRPHPLSTA
jgi:dolichol-phosphate mannosyltransferase